MVAIKLDALVLLQVLEELLQQVVELEQEVMELQVVLVVELVAEQQVDQVGQEILPQSVQHKVLMVEVLLLLIQITLRVAEVEQPK